MRKVFIYLVIASIFFGFAIRSAYSASALPSPTAFPVEVDSYELFWPLVHGRVLGDSLYNLKLTKENIEEFLSLTTFKKSEFNIRLSEKRLVEAEYLIKEKKDLENANRTLELAKQRREKAVKLAREAKEKGTNTDLLSAKIRNSLGKQILLLNSLGKREAVEEINSLFLQLP